MAIVVPYFTTHNHFCHSPHGASDANSAFVGTGMSQIATANSDFGNPPRPLYPWKRTYAVHQRMSAKGQKRTSLHSLSGRTDYDRWRSTGLPFASSTTLAAPSFSVPTICIIAKRMAARRITFLNVCNAALVRNNAVCLQTITRFAFENLH